MTSHQVQIIERLREAAKEHGEVADLLACLASSFIDIGNGDSEFHGDAEDLEYLKAAVSAAAFVEYDRTDGV